MDKDYSKTSNNIGYAELSEGEANKLKELEQTFNNQFDCDYYLMVMKKDNMKL
jgi:2-oxo-4-hydroxy-4-carboxy--5-ureidoimidazoline (OHCU) decarboxylase